MITLLLLACAPDVPSPCATRWFDGDGDGFGDGGWSASSCDVVGSWVAEAGDCDDADAAIHPGADERCNALDDNCDGDAEIAELRYEDADGDGFGADGTEVLECTGAGSPVGGDCDDTDVDVNPGAAEVAGDGVDNDCDGGDAAWGPFQGTASESATKVTGMGGYAMDAGPGGVVIQDSDAVLRFPLSARGLLVETDAVARFERLDDASSFGADLLYVPDQDGDGVEDILIGSIEHGRVGISSAAYLVSGAATGTLDPSDGIGSVEAIDDQQTVGTCVRWLDGDLLIAVGDGRVDMRLFTAPMVGVRTTDEADAVITGDGTDPYDAATPGDLDGDGIGDVVYTGYIDQATLVAWTVRGPQETMSLSDADARWEGAQDANAAVIAGVGDLTGDGTPDVLIGGRPAVWMPADPFAGGDLGASGAEILGFGTDFSAGDLNGDGLLDLVAGAGPEGDGGRGVVAGFLGPLGGGTLTHEDAELRIWGDNPGDYLGYYAASGFDADGDGFDDAWFTAAEAGTTYLALSSAWPDGV